MIFDYFCYRNGYFIGIFKCLSRIRGGDPGEDGVLILLDESFPHTRG